MVGFSYYPCSFYGSTHLMYAYLGHSFLSRLHNIRQQSVYMINIEESNDEIELFLSCRFQNGLPSHIRVMERKHGQLFPGKNASIIFPNNQLYDNVTHRYHYIDGIIKKIGFCNTLSYNEWGDLKIEHYNGTPGYQDEQDTEYIYDSDGRVILVKTYDLYPQRVLCEECRFDYDEKGNVIHHRIESDLGREECRLEYKKLDLKGNWTHRLAFNKNETFPRHTWRDIIYSDDSRRIEEINRWLEGIPPSHTVSEMPIEDNLTTIEDADNVIIWPENPRPFMSLSSDSNLPF